MAMVRALALVALALGLADAADKTKCPWGVGKQPFDENKMAGEWYIVAGTPLLGARLSKCPKFSLTPTRAGDALYLNFRLSGVNPADGSTFRFESVSQATRPERGAAVTQGVWRREGSAKYNEVYKQVVVQTDYDTYAVFLACRPIFNATSNAFGRHMAAQVWARQPAGLPAATLHVLLNLLSSFDVDPAAVQIADHSCAQ